MFSQYMVNGVSGPHGLHVPKRVGMGKIWGLDQEKDNAMLLNLPMEANIAQE